MNTTHVHVSEAPPTTSWANFVRHLIEMLVAMLIGMATLGAAVSIIFGLLGHSNVLHYAGLRGLLMTGYMIVGMSVWMRHRRHAWATVGEMAIAMTIPYVLLIGPYSAGALSEAAFLGAMHLLMIPLMIVAMLRRRDEYAQDHRSHSRPRAVALPRAFARFNRRFANPIVRRVAGRLPPFAIVGHAGRTSRRPYRTPVAAFANGDALVFTLVYGAHSDWVRNVVAADAATVTRHGMTETYGDPQIARGEEAVGSVPTILRVPVRLLGVEVLRMTKMRRYARS
jgi:deazaflavin-dependent oxidoreductase (nitroreductase family)